MIPAKAGFLNGKTVEEQVSQQKCSVRTEWKEKWDMIERGAEGMRGKELIPQVKIHSTLPTDEGQQSTDAVYIP